MSAENLIEHISSMMNFVNIQRLWMQRHLEPIAKKYKLKMSDLSLMLLLHINKELKTAKDIAMFSDLKRGNISLIVESLSCRGFIKQLAVEGDRRMKKLELTSKCDGVLNECDEILLALFKIMIEGIAEDELLRAKEVFVQMYKNIEKEEHKYLEENR